MHPLEAQIACSRLHAAGIPAQMLGAQTIQMHWLWSNALGGVQVQVPQTQEARGLQVLKDMEAGKFELPEQPS